MQPAHTHVHTRTRIHTRMLYTVLRDTWMLTELSFCFSPHTMPPVHRDPRVGHDYDYSFVESVPLPIASQKGLKIQARSEVVYNPAFPSRNEVRRENYSRRRQQVMQQGFSSVNFKPYKGIGDPFYLDQKKLILHALGQWEDVSVG